MEEEGRVPLVPLADLRVLAAGEIDRNGALRVEAIGNCHPPIDESYALRFTDM